MGMRREVDVPFVICLRISSCNQPVALGPSDVDIAEELVLGVEAGSVPCYRATRLAGLLSQKFRKHGNPAALTDCFSACPESSVL